MIYNALIVKNEIGTAFDYVLSNSKKMNNKILAFKKTNHFLHSQWDRSINDQLLYKVLPFVECTNSEKDVILVMPSHLQKKGIAKDDKQCLILVINGNLLVTGYWCDHPNYLFNKKDKVHFQILY